MTRNPVPRRFAAALAASLACLAPPTAAGEGVTEVSQPGGFSLRGFGTLGIARSNTDDAEFIRDLSQPRGVSRRASGKVDSLLGIQANLRLNERVEFVTQAISRYNFEGNYRPGINWAFVRFDPTATTTLRAGRLGTEFYMLADSRQVGYSYLTVRPPGDYYGTLPFNYVDGIDASTTLPLGGGLLRAKAFAGHDPESLPINGEEWELKGSQMLGAYLDFQKGSWQWRVGAAQIRFKRDFALLTPLIETLNLVGATNVAERIGVAGRKARLYSAGMVFDDGPLQLQMMLSQTRQESATYENTQAGYVIGAYRIAGVTPFAGLSWSRSRKSEIGTGLPDVPPFDEINAAFNLYMAKGHTHQKTLILGSRWDLRTHLALKAQLDLVRGRADSIFLVQQNTPSYDGKMNVFSLALDFVF